MDQKPSPEWKTKKSPEYISRIVHVWIFSFAVIWDVIFNVQKYYVTGFRVWRSFMEIIQTCMTYFHIKMIGWQELKLSLIKDQICQK